jgi:hypothetical protein
MLAPVLVEREALDVAVPGDEDDDIGVGDQVLEGPRRERRNDAGPAGVAAPFLEVRELVDDQSV